MKTAALACLLLVACGSQPPPPPVTDEPAAAPARRTAPTSGGPSVAQELGSIDPRAVEQTFAKLQSKLETCHQQGRGRVEVLAGDVKLFLRVGQDGRVRYAYFEETTLGDRATEKCILDTLSAADWPKPQGGEAEVRNGFGWSPGGERAPASWAADKVTGALDDDAKAAVAKCKGSVSASFHVTGYVEPAEDAPAPATKAPPSKKKAAAAPAPVAGGKFKSLGVAAPNKDGAEKVDCIVDALKGVPLPTPGSYVAKVTFSI